MRLECCKRSRNQTLIGYSSDEAVFDSACVDDSDEILLGGLKAYFGDVSLKREFNDGFEGY